MISRDWNRASVAIWSVGNETPYSENRMEFLTGLIDKARALDNSRLVSAALLGGSAKDFQNLILAIASLGLESEIPTPTEKMILKGLVEKFNMQNDSFKGLAITLDDPIGQYLDIVALNEYFGWYYSVFLAPQIQISEKTFRLLMLELLPEIRINNVFSKPIHLSEFGAGAKFGKSGEGIWTESYQAMVYKAQIAMIKNNLDTIQGYSPWILKDFRSMMRPLAGIQDYYNRKGLMDENGNKKKAYYHLQKFYETGQ
jgi:beta-glucuronidase